MIILTAKQKGPPDSLAQYINHLKNPRIIKKAKYSSKVFHAKQRHINQHMWVDGFHQGSEVPAYYTRYLVTIKGSLAVLVTYSAHKDHYKKYASDFASSINSLRVMNVSPDFASRQRGSMGMGSVQNALENMINADDELGGLDGGIDGKNRKGLIGLFQKPEILASLGLLGALLAYLFLKRRKKKKLEKGTAAAGRSSSRKDHRGRRGSRSSSDRRRSSSRSRRR